MSSSENDTSDQRPASKGRRGASVQSPQPQEAQADLPTNEEIADVVEDVIEASYQGSVFRGAVREVISMEMESFSGPVPSPRTMREYAELYPDAPEIIFKSFHEQGEHRRQLEDFALRSNAARSTEGLRAGFIVTMTCVAASVYLIMNGHSNEGLAIIAIDLIALASVFVYGSQQQRKERERKTQIMAEAMRGETGINSTTENIAIPE